LPQHGFTNAPDKERPKQRFVRPVKEQIAMELAIRGQCLIEHQLQHRRGLAGVVKGRRLVFEAVQFLGQQAANREPERNTGRKGSVGQEKSIKISEKLDIRSAGRKVEVPEHLLDGRRSARGSYRVRHPKLRCSNRL
jgi:hypothetical protein